MTTEDVTWLAGWLEGEGYFGVCKGTPVLAVNSTDLDIVQRAATLMNNCEVRLCKLKNTKWKPQHRIQIYSRRALDAMKLVRPYMGLRRGLAIDRVFRYCEEREVKRIQRATSTIERRNNKLTITRDGSGKFAKAKGR